MVDNLARWRVFDSFVTKFAGQATVRELQAALPELPGEDVLAVLEELQRDRRLKINEGRVEPRGCGFNIRGS
jgi:hypothetical protein